MTSLAVKTACILTVAAAAIIGAGIVHDPLKGNNVAEAAGALPVAIDPNHIDPMQIGITTGGLLVYGTEEPFNDIVQTSAEVKVQTSKGWEMAEGLITLDAHGYPVKVPKGTNVVVTLRTAHIHLSAGRYHCRISPGWNLSAFGHFTIEGSGTAFNIVVTPKAVNDAGVTFMINPKGATASLSELSCLRDGAPGLWNPAFLNDIKPFRVIRYMQWMQTNGTPPGKWSARPTRGFLSQSTPSGVALENMVDLTNTSGTDPWFNIPWDADDEYVRAFATYVRDHVDPSRKIYIELSNEVWNTQFPSSKSATMLGKARYPHLDDTHATDAYYGDRLREVMGIWTTVFRGQEKRIVRIYGGQAVWFDRFNDGLAHNDTWRSVDALATAPYFGVDGSTYDPRKGDDLVEAIFTDSAKIVGTAIDQAKGAKRIAAKYGLRYMTYEGGSGFQTPDVSVNPALVKVTRDPRIYDMYTLFLTRWKKEVGGLLMVFDLTSEFGQYGSWGHISYTGQPLADAPKMRALVDFVRNNDLAHGSPAAPASTTPAHR